MNRRGGFTLLAALVITVAGCKKDSSSPAGPAPGSQGIAEQEPNDVTAQVLGTLGTADIVLSGSAASANDIDRYSVSLTGTTNLHAEIAWSGSGDLDVGVMNPGGIMIAFQRTGANPERCTIAGQPPGTYAVYVSANSVAAANAYPQAYTLRIGAR